MENVLLVHSSSDLQNILQRYTTTVVVLFCKARSCRSCKYFTKKYHRVAQQHPDKVFLELVCDESKDAFSLMQDLKVPVVPHFVLYKSGKETARLSSTSEEKLEETIQNTMR